MISSFFQVTTLVNLKYLVKVSKSDSLDAVKYKVSDIYNTHIAF